MPNVASVDFERLDENLTAEKLGLIIDELLAPDEASKLGNPNELHPRALILRNFFMNHDSGGVEDFGRSTKAVVELRLPLVPTISTFFVYEPVQMTNSGSHTDEPSTTERRAQDRPTTIRLWRGFETTQLKVRSSLISDKNLLAHSHEATVESNDGVIFVADTASQSGSCRHAFQRGNYETGIGTICITDIVIKG